MKVAAASENLLTGFLFAKLYRNSWGVYFLVTMLLAFVIFVFSGQLLFSLLAAIFGPVIFIGVICKLVIFLIKKLLGQ